MSANAAAGKDMPSANKLLLMGIALTVFGIIAIGNSALAGVAVIMVVGVMMVVSGVVLIFQGVGSESWSSMIMPLVLGALFVLGGAGVLAHPWLSLGVFTWMLAIFFVVEGVWKIIASFSFRPAAGWIAILISGVLGLVLGMMILNQWPSSELWAIGILVGVDLLFTGASLVGLSATMRQIGKVHPTTGSA